MTRRNEVAVVISSPSWATQSSEAIILLIEAMALKAIAPIAIFSTIFITVFTVWFDLPADFIVKMVTCPN